MARKARCALSVALTVALAASHAYAAMDQAYWEQQAAAVKAACSLSSFYGEAFYMGATVLSTQIANDVGACCAQCDANPSCSRWTYCPLTQPTQCDVPVGPFAGQSVPQGTCILSRSPVQSNVTVGITWSQMQPGVVWASGLKSSSPATVEIKASAASSQENQEIIGSQLDSFYCRKVVGGNLQLTTVAAGVFGPSVAAGDKVTYTGLTVRDQQSDEWAIIYSNATKLYWRYPSAGLGPCDGSESVCMPSPSGGRNEEGTSCEQDEDCCSGMVCTPRVSTGQNPVAAIGTTQATGQVDVRKFALEPNTTDGLFVLPGECTPLAREYISTNWPSVTFDWSAPGSPPTITCQIRSNGFVWRDGDTWNASAPKTFTDSNPVPWETWAATLCSDVSTAGPVLAESLKKGGVEAARAFNASTFVCSDGRSLRELFYNYVNPPFIGNWDSVAEYAAAYVAAGDSVGAAVCVSLAGETRNGVVLRQLQVHTPVNGSSPQPPPVPVPAPAPAPAPQPQPSPSLSSNTTGVIVGVVVAGVVVCIVGALLAIYFVRRRRRRQQQLAEAALKGFGSARHGMVDGEIDDFLGTSSYASKTAEAEAAAAKLAEDGLGSLPFGSVPSQTETPSPVTVSRTSAGARTISGRTSTPSTLSSQSRDYVLSAIASVKAQRSARLSGGSGSEGAATVSPRRGSSGLDARPWEIAFEELRIVRSCGEGSYGKVYMGTWHETDVAIKILLGTTMVNSQEEAEEALEAARKMVGHLDDEAGLMASLRHPNCVPFFAVCHNPPCIVTEYCARGGLDSVLAEARRLPAALAELSWPRRLSLVLDAARGMLYLHRRSVPVLHRDLKSPNILVDESWHAKVADFNLSRLVEESARSSSLAAMNPRWLAPEIMQGAHASKASDVYSFGVVLWEVLTLQLPFASGTQGPWQIVSFVVHGGRPEVPTWEQLPGADTPQFEGLGAYIGLMQRCWAQDADARPDFVAIVAELKTLMASLTGCSETPMNDNLSGEAELRTGGGSSVLGPAALPMQDSGSARSSAGQRQRSA